MIIEKLDIRVTLEISTANSYLLNNCIYSTRGFQMILRFLQLALYIKNHRVMTMTKSVTSEEQSLKIKGLKYTFGKVKTRINA